ncbi:hypothetical protein [Actinokineospora sp. NBRC 105648]|uniref:hypothetical protein n=1 Tax=Actinokineospora sp. NBRC 105648 TaxID=3032206 RepID=UPI002554D74D|nr:hypothetical protein [Actinokineospora sp. NBRC 105648]
MELRDLAWAKLAVAPASTPASAETEEGTAVDSTPVTRIRRGVHPLRPPAADNGGGWTESGGGRAAH